MTEQIIPTLIESLKEEYSKERGNSVHVSDLIYCPREAIFRRLRQHELKPVELMFFSTGQAYHTILQSLLRWLGKKNVQIEQKVNYNDVVGHVDAIINKIPCEFKSHRSKTHQTKPHYVQQLKCYMSILGSNVGKLISIGLTIYDQPFKEFDVIMTDSEIKKQLEWIDKEATQFKLVLEKKDWKLARAVKEDKNLNWKCNNCAFQKECFAFENAKVTK